MTPQAGQSGAGAVIVHVLWASNDRYPPQFISAWPEGLVHAWNDWFLTLRTEAERGYRELAVEDGPWEFWMTVERIQRPASAPEDGVTT